MLLQTSTGRCTPTAEPFPQHFVEFTSDSICSIFLAPPHVEMSLGYTVKQGEEARIQCKVSGKPRPTVQWYKDGQPLTLQRNARISITSREIYIRSTTLEDHGTYDCKATNKNGERIAHMVLDVMPGE